MIVKTNANATYLLKSAAPKPTVGATSNMLTIIDPKQHGQGAITAAQVAAVVFFSKTYHSLIVKMPASIIITAMIIKKREL